MSGWLEYNALRSIWLLGLGLVALTTVGIYIISGTVATVTQKYVLQLSVPGTPNERFRLGPQARSFKPPRNTTPDPGLRFSLWEEAQHMTRVGPFLHISKDGVSDELYGISMYHQLHCLDMLRAAIMNPDSPRHVHKRDMESDTEDDMETELDHLIHCIDYISEVYDFQGLLPSIQHMSVLTTASIIAGSSLCSR